MDLYLSIKVIHIVAVISWMVGLFYLPRLFVYHVENKSYYLEKTFLVMEEKLLKIIMNPSMIVTWVSGIVMIWITGFESLLIFWVYTKIIFVLCLSAFHGFLVTSFKNLKSGKNKKKGDFYRMVNEIPTVLLILIVILVVFKPA
jgi:putative membrane protein